MKIDLSGIPDNWFLQCLECSRTPIGFDGDTYINERWVCQLQHEQDGRQTGATADTPQGAVDAAIGGILMYLRSQDYTKEV